MRSKAPWKPIAILTTTSTVLLLLLLPACCGMRIPSTTTAPQIRIPPIGTEPIPTPSEAKAKAPTQTEMHNVDFHIDETTILRIHRMRGTMQSKQAGDPLNFDNRTSFVMKIDTAEIGMESRSLDNLMNRYVFSDPHAPLRGLHITIQGKQLVQQGIMHKLIDIPFTMWADVSASEGRIRIHPTKISIGGLNGISLLNVFGQSLQKMLALPKDRGVTVENNDLLLDPGRILPPPEIRLKLVAARISGDELVQVFDAGLKLPPLAPPRPREKNWMYYREGTLRMGKLLMVDADMQVIDTDPSDPFDFFIDRYNDQLVAGHSQTQPNYGLVVFMRDFRNVGLPLKTGEKG
jgi:hypothetical protein